MREPREGEIVTPSSITAALRVAAGDGFVPDSWDTIYDVRSGDIAAHVVMRVGLITADRGPAERADVRISAGPGIRDLLAGTLSADEALSSGAVEVDGDPELFARFAATMRVPYSASLALAGEAAPPEG